MNAFNLHWRYFIYNICYSIIRQKFFLLTNIARYQEKKRNKMEICHLYQNDFEMVAFQLISYFNEINGGNNIIISRESC